MGAIGSDAAVEAADVVIIDDRPSKVPRAVRSAKRTQGIVMQNIVLGLAAKFGIMLFTLLGFANMWLAILGDVGVLVLCVLNATRAMGGRPKDAVDDGGRCPTCSARASGGVGGPHRIVQGRAPNNYLKAIQNRSKERIPCTERSRLRGARWV